MVQSACYQEDHTALLMLIQPPGNFAYVILVLFLTAT
jgi:hypothetical protein